jgi:lipid II:glycine glycyltransferase (peptidoglycan interpeptide bridge formation enzyme)
MISTTKTHVLQSPLWAEFKNAYGTPAILAGNVLYTKHAIPFSSNFYAYSPRVNPFVIDFDALKKSLEANSCITIHFDVPNVVKSSEDAPKAVAILEKHCVKSPRDEFAKGNFLLDLTKSEDDILKNMHTKQRYNISYAQKKGLTTCVAQNDTDFDAFYSLYEETGKRQKFYYRSHKYLKTIWTIFHNAGAGDILLVEHAGKALAGWLLMTYENVLYYVYGGSSEENKNLQASCLIGWEAIIYGKNHGCAVFDMWGAAYDPNDITDPYYGFTQFKAKFGATHVQYIDSYDYIINPTMYKIFNTANSVRWRLLNILR